MEPVEACITCQRLSTCLAPSGPRKVYTEVAFQVEIVKGRRVTGRGELGSFVAPSHRRTYLAMLLY